ncbi:MAG: LamG domain-containing protein, partial [Verrucomicrobiae bacterium]|nr:LamG domain-containing protein [Verrucomicrobiae bacterium]
GPLFADLRFNDGDGTIATDSTGNGWNGQLVEGPLWLDGSQAKVHGGLEVTGGSHVVLPVGVVSTLDDFTVSLWVKLNSISTWARVFDFGYADGANTMYFTPRTAGGVARFGIKINNVGQNLEAPAALPTGDWVHLAVTSSGSTTTLYLNGVEVASNPSMTFKPSDMGITDQNYVGATQFSWDPFLDGAVDEFKIFSAALSPEEVATLAAMPHVDMDPVATSGNSRVELGWNPVIGASGYTVMRSVESGGPYADLVTVSSPGHADESVINGQIYHYIVVANGGLADGATSPEVIGSPEKGTATVTLENLTPTYDGTPKPVTAVTSPEGLEVEITYDGSPAPPSLPGTYAVSAVVNDLNYQGVATGFLVIGPRTFSDWQSTHFTPSEILAGDHESDADPDGDSLVNLAEYALGSDPHSFTPQPNVTRTDT